MKTTIKTLTMTTLSLAAILTLSGCGDTTDELESTLNISESTSLSGVAVDPELVGATVFVDANENGIYDEGETTTLTDDNGAFTLAIKNENISKAIIVKNGVDKVTKEPFTGTFSAQLEGTKTSQNITPLTTLVHKYYKQNSTKTLEEVKAEVAAALKLEVSALDSNPMEDSELLKVAMQLESVAQMIDKNDDNTTYEDVYEKYAEHISSGITIDTLVSGVVDSEGLSLDDLEKEKVKSLYKSLTNIDTTSSLSSSVALSIDNVRDAIDKAEKSDDLDHDFANDESLLIHDDEMQDESDRRDKENEHTSSDNSSESHEKLDVTTMSYSELNDDIKYTLAYMWNEERLAYDIYNALGALNSDTKVFTNIAQRSEIKHISLVEDLVKKYDLNITNLVDYKENYSLAELQAFAPGEYSIGAIQDLYDTLFSKGEVSKQAALEVGCMVEVVDVDDLDKDIIIAQEANATDVVSVFEVLRSGSYSHYWAFNQNLINMGVSEGCAVLGDEYNKTGIYPQNENENKNEDSNDNKDGEMLENGEGNFPEGKGPREH